jgi:hypothetical protein
MQIPSEHYDLPLMSNWELKMSLAQALTRGFGNETGLFGALEASTGNAGRPISVSAKLPQYG